MFKDETVLSGMNELSKESWRVVAKDNDLPPPDDDLMDLAMGAACASTTRHHAPPHAPLAPRAPIAGAGI